MFNKLGKLIFYYFAGSASIVALGFFVYYQFLVQDVPIIEIKEVDVAQLTDIPEVDKLKVWYKYDSVQVKNLWKVKYFVQSVGPTTIIGEGNLKTILSDRIPLETSNVSRVFALDIEENDFPISIVRNRNNTFGLQFKQWKTGEYFEIHGLVETTNNQKPKITIDPQEIIESEVYYSKYLLSSPKEDSKLIDKISPGLASFLKWMVIIFIVGADIAAIIAIRKELKKQSAPNNTFAFQIFVFIIWLLMTIIFSAPLLWIF